MPRDIVSRLGRIPHPGQCTLCGRTKSEIGAALWVTECPLCELDFCRNCKDPETHTCAKAPRIRVEHEVVAVAGDEYVKTLHRRATDEKEHGHQRWYDREEGEEDLPDRDRTLIRWAIITSVVSLTVAILSCILMIWVSASVAAHTAAEAEHFLKLETTATRNMTRLDNIEREMLKHEQVDSDTASQVDKLKDEMRVQQRRP